MQNLMFQSKKKCRTAYYTDVETYPGTSVGAGFTDNMPAKTDNLIKPALFPVEERATRPN